MPAARANTTGVGEAPHRRLRTPLRRLTDASGRLTDASGAPTRAARSQSVCWLPAASQPAPLASLLPPEPPARAPRRARPPRCSRARRLLRCARRLPLQGTVHRQPQWSTRCECKSARDAVADAAPRTGARGWEGTPRAPRLSRPSRTQTSAHADPMMPSLQMRQSNIVKPKSEKVRVPTRGRARCRLMRPRPAADSPHSPDSPAHTRARLTYD